MSSTYYDPVSGMATQKQRTTAIRSTPQFQQFIAPYYPASEPFAASASQTQGQAPPGYGSYQQVLQNDPVYAQTLQDLSAGLISDRASADAAIKRSLIQFGEVPAFEGLDAQAVGPEFGALANEVRPLAEQNTREGLSIAARLDKQYKDNIRALRNALAARGLHRSGELGYQLGEEAQRFKGAQYDTRQKLLDFLTGVNAGVANAQRQARAQQAAALGQAVQTNIGLFPTGFTSQAPPPSQPVPAPPATNAIPAPLPQGQNWAETQQQAEALARRQRRPVGF